MVDGFLFFDGYGSVCPENSQWYALTLWPQSRLPLCSDLLYRLWFPTWQSCKYRFVWPPPFRLHLYTTVSAANTTSNPKLFPKIISHFWNEGGIFVNNPAVFVVGGFLVAVNTMATCMLADIGAGLVGTVMVEVKLPAGKRVMHRPDLCASSQPIGVVIGRGWILTDFYGKINRMSNNISKL